MLHILIVEDTPEEAAVLRGHQPGVTGSCPCAARDETSHGIGTRSMQALTERYDGIFSASQHDDAFCLDGAFPLPE